MKPNSFINDKTINNIDFDYILNLLEPLTVYGKEKLKNIIPYKKGEENILNNELDIIECIIKVISENKTIIKNLEHKLSEIKDIRNAIDKSKKGQVLSEIELYEIKYFILLLSDIEVFLNSLGVKKYKELMVYPITYLQSLLDPEDNKLKTFYIYDSYSFTLKNIREEKKLIKEKISAEYKKIKNNISKDLDIKVKLNGEVVVPKSNKNIIEKISKYPFLTYKSETYMDIRFSIKDNEIIDDLKEKLQILELEEEKEELSIRYRLTNDIAKYSDDIFRNIDKIANLDFKLAKAKMAIKINGTRPIISKKKNISIKEGRFVKIENLLKEKNKEFIPISINLSRGVTCITGANMGGKTVSLKLVGLLTAMAHFGLYVPCTHMEFYLIDYIFTSIGDSQSIDMGLSSFGGEIENIKYALGRQDEEGLILLDELGRGTNPFEGYAISKAIVNYLKDKNNIAILTTHFDNIANDKDILHLQVIGLRNVDFNKLKNNLSIEILSELMDYRLVEVNNKNEVPRDAINIARLMGLDQNIICEANNILNEKLRTEN